MGTTPIYGIRYPEPTTKAYLLPESFQNLALDTEGALSAAAIPPAVPAPVMVAATAAARDLYWGIPANNTQRQTLQNKGATTIRTDLGYTEQYYNLYNASTNPGGALVSGWSPISGTAIGAKLSRNSTAFSLANSAYTQLTSVGFSTIVARGGVTVTTGSDTRITIPTPGLYRISAFLYASGAGQRILAVTKNAAAPEGVGDIVRFQPPVVSLFEPLLAGDILRFFGYQDSGASLPLPVGGALNQLMVDYMGPV